MNIQEVTFCGLYCRLCTSRTRIPQQAAALRETLRKEGYDQGYFDTPGLADVFPSFWQGLNILVSSPCPGCRAGGGYPGCPIRLCARERAVTVCADCPDYPCERLAMLSHYPTLRADNEHLRQIGLERWIEEQEERARCGFCYADVRIPRGEGET